VSDVGPHETVRALSELAQKVGVEVRIEPFELKIAGKGGLCRVDGRPVIVVDANLGPLEQAGVIGEALRHFDWTDVDVPPELAGYVRKGRGRAGRVVRLKPLKRVK